MLTIFRTQPVDTRFQHARRWVPIQIRMEYRKSAKECTRTVQTGVSWLYSSAWTETKLALDAKGRTNLFIAMVALEYVARRSFESCVDFPFDGSYAENPFKVFFKATVFQTCWTAGRKHLCEWLCTYHKAYRRYRVFRISGRSIAYPLDVSIYGRNP